MVFLILRYNSLLTSVLHQGYGVLLSLSRASLITWLSSTLFQPLVPFSASVYANVSPRFTTLALHLLFVLAGYRHLHSLNHLHMS